MTTRRMLSKTLAHLHSGELEEFCLHVELEKGVPLLSELDLKSIDSEKIEELMVKRCSEEECVKLTRNILKKMNRTDLVKRLFDDRRESEEEHSMDEEPLSLTQRVEKMTSVIELLVEIMAYLTEDQYEEFKKLIRYEGYETYNSYNPRLLWQTNHQDIACVTVLTFGQNSVVKTMKILKRMNRTDLVQKLLETSSSFKKKPSDEPRSVLLEKVATIAAVKDLLLEILHSLNNGELKKFKKFLLSAFQTDSKDIPYLLRHSNERTEILDVMVQTYGRQSVDETRKILKKLHRDDLVQMFSETSSEPKVDEHQPPVFEKTVKEDVKHVLLETLSGLKLKEFEKFKWVLQLTDFQRSFTRIQWYDMEWATTPDELVHLMVMNQQPVEVTKEVLLDMNRTDLVERLMGTDSGLQEEHSMDEEPLSLTQRVEKMTSVIELLVEIMACLTEDQCEEFKKLIRYEGYKTYNSYNLRLLWQTNHQDIACVTFLTFVQNSVVKTMKILKRMNRTDLVQKLLETSSSFKKKPSDEPRSVLLEKAATIAAVKDLLWEILHSLNNGELEKFQKFLLSAFQTDSKDIPYLRRHSNDRTEILDVMVQTYGRQSVDETRKILKKLHRDDLVQMFSETSSEPKVDEHQPPVFEKTVKEDVKHVLSETLSGLKLKEFEKFKWVLQLTYFQRSFTRIQWYDMKWATTPDKLVHLMVMNQQPAEVTKEVLLDMNRTDLVERLMGTDSGLQEKHRPEQPHQTSTITSLHWTLRQTLRGLRYEEHELFKQHLLHITQQKGLPEAPEQQMKKADMDGIVMLMVEIYGQQSVELTKDILQRMNRTDLVRKLSESSSGFNTEKKLQQKDPQHESTMTPVHSQLLETLEELGSGDLEKFKHALLYTKMKKGLPKIPRDQVETADKDEIVKLMVEIYGQRCVEVTKDVLERMNRTDLVGKLSESSSVSKGPFGCVEPDDCGQKMPDSGHWTKLDPEVNSTDGDESPTYSLQSEAGNCFECNVSGIRWICKDKVSFQYKFCSWEEHIERMESLKYLPAGPLMNIKVIAGKFDEVYLPHWICIDGNTDILGEFAVLHIDDCGDVVEQVSEVTPCHVKLAEPVFSSKGVLIRVGARVKTRCSVLIFKNNKAFLKLNVYLIPCDPGLREEILKIESTNGNKEIRKPPEYKPLRMKDRFILSTDMDGAVVRPKEVKLKYEFTDPQYFQVCIRNPDADFLLELTKKNESIPVWTCTIDEDDYQTNSRAPDDYQGTSHAPAARPSAGATGVDTTSDDKHFVDKHRIQLTERVSHMEPILDRLLEKGVLQEEAYNKIRALPTSQQKMRELYSGCLKAGAASKAIFYDILLEFEEFLIDDLKTNH
ncbi:uncharacterized protein LOC132983621 [Labrus mixtus]|uniref:uncharacterized protein LOC132983621 n=1 Tax=Labrus mixtus TaxID=508554 RepID=UPI0029BFC5BD|nr:uncharacterized protein LOC132983621 [Labrus mixtus]